MASSLRRDSTSESDLALDSLADDIDGGTPNRLELLTILATRVRNTVTCLVIYIILLVLNSFVLAWELSGRQDHWALIVIESFVNFFLVTEVLLAMVTLGRAYWQSKANIADFVITLICLVFFIIFLQEEAPSQSDPDALSYIDGIVLALRYVTQFSRLLVFFFRSRHTREVLKHRHDIQLPSVQLENFEEVFLPQNDFGSDLEMAETTSFMKPADARNHDPRSAKLPHIRAQQPAIAIGAPQITLQDSQSNIDVEQSVSQSASHSISVSESHSQSLDLQEVRDFSVSAAAAPKVNGNGVTKSGGKTGQPDRIARD